MPRRFAALLVLAVLCFAGSSAAAGQYFSLAGDFTVSYPDPWYQVDYQTVDYHMSKGGTVSGIPAYEAVFSADRTLAFYETGYVILTLDTIGEMTPRRIDSLLGGWQTTFDRPVQTQPLISPIPDTLANLPCYDRERNLAWVLLDAGAPPGPPIHNLVALKFYQRGVAGFYCYSPHDRFARDLPVFLQMLESFTPGDVRTTGGQVKVADLDRVASDDAADPASGGDTGSWLPIGGGGVVVIALIVVILRVRRRKQA
jgi:hypothetical protein